jgi:hypothetical protein
MISQEHRERAKEWLRTELSQGCGHTHMSEAPSLAALLAESYEAGRQRGMDQGWAAATGVKP